MLSRMNQDMPDFGMFRQFPAERCDFHEVRTGSHNADDFHRLIFSNIFK